jgi:hypothetical protein
MRMAAPADTDRRRSGATLQQQPRRASLSAKNKSDTKKDPAEYLADLARLEHPEAGAVTVKPLPGGRSLWCNVCRDKLGNKMSRILDHLGKKDKDGPGYLAPNKKHQANKKTQQGAAKGQANLVQLWSDYKRKVSPLCSASFNQSQALPSGSTKPDDLMANRADVVRIHLANKIPLARFDDDEYRDRWERSYGTAMAKSKTMANLIPFIEAMELERVSQLVKDKDISVAFDSTPLFAEVSLALLSADFL